MTEQHHEYPDTYADSWEDCVVVGEGATENAKTAEYWGGNPGDAIVSLSDWTDGPRTRVRFLTTAESVKETFAQGKRFRLKPHKRGEFVVSEYQKGDGMSDCVIMRAPAIPAVNAASVEKWVPRGVIPEEFPIGRRFSLGRVKEGA